MAIKETDATALKLGGTTKVLFTPFADGVKGTVTYSLDNIVADSTSITQDDPTTNEIACETRDEPIFENITLGKYTFTATSGDIQKDLLVEVMGFTYDTTKKIIYAPSTYKEIWGEIEIVFGDKGSLVCPKVKLNGKIEASSLKTGMVQGTISGTCYSVDVTIDSTTTQTPFYVKEAGSGIAQTSTLLQSNITTDPKKGSGL